MSCCESLFQKELTARPIVDSISVGFGISGKELNLMAPLRSYLDLFLSLPYFLKEDIIFEFLNRFPVDFEKNQDTIKSIIKLIERSNAINKYGQETSVRLSKTWEFVVEDDRLTLRQQLSSVVENGRLIMTHFNFTRGFINVFHPPVRWLRFCYHNHLHFPSIYV
jgi:hypothetical protein